MASSGEQSVTPMDDDDIRGDGKKKKFKPLSAVRKFFGKRKGKKEDSVVAVKAHSTTALHPEYGDDDDDDDGGFKSYIKPSALAGNRSISEDSVFSPEARENLISPFPKAALSEESLPAKSAFQSELFSKLNKRRSQYSDEDHDDGLPRSPVPPVTTADVIMGGPLKPVNSVKKSNNRDSDQSLISVDSSENEEEDLFQSKWKQSVPAKITAVSKAPKATDGAMDSSMDFNSIQKTEVLQSSAAKDKISIKPPRKASRQSRKKKDTPSPQSLPSLNEESPSRTQPEEIKTSWTQGSTSTTTQGKGAVSKTDEKVNLSSSAPSSSPLSYMDAKPSSKPNLPSSISISSKGEKSIGSLGSPSSASVSATTATGIPTKATTPTSPNAKVTASSVSTKIGGVTYTASTGKSASSQNLSSPSGVGSYDKKSAENLSSSDRGSNKFSSTDNNNMAANKFSQSQRRATDDDKPNSSIKSRMTQFQSPASGSNKVDFNSSPDKSPAVTKLDSDETLPDKEDFKLRRQNRSKTLPGVTEEQSSPKVHRASSQRIQASSTSITTQQRRPLSSTMDKTVVPEDSTTPAGPPVSSSGKKVENVKFASVDSPTSASKEPSWMNMVRKKKEEAEEESTNTVSPLNKDKSVADSSKSAQNSSVKSVSSASSYLEKKRGSVETISFKNRDAVDQTHKKDTYDSSAKRPSIDIGSVKRESIDIDISEMSSSVKAIRNSFSANKEETGTKFSSSQRENKTTVPSTTTTSSTSDRAKLFSGSSSAGNANQESRSGTESAGNIKPSGGINQFRSGSIKTSPTKSVEKSSFPTRGGSVKAVGTTSVSSASSSVLNKSDSPSATKPESQGSSATPSYSSSKSSSLHHSVHGPQSNTSLSSPTHSVNSSSSATNNKPFSNAYQPNIPSNLASTTASSTQASSKVSSNSFASPQTTATPAGSVGVKSASNSGGVKSVSFSGVKSVASNPPVASNVSTPVSSSVTTSTPASSSSTTTSSSSMSPSRSSSVRSQSSVTFKPQVSSTSPSFSSRKSFTDKSSPSKPTPQVEDTKGEEKKAETKANVPAWRANLSKKDVKIEIIENSSSTSSTPSSSQNKSEILRKGSDTAKKTESGPSSGTNLQAEKASNRSSKVLDMVKNFQNLQVTS